MKKKRQKSHTGRVIDMLGSVGYLVDPVERKIKWNLTKDWLGFGDLIAVGGNVMGMLVVQVTSPSNVAARVHKILSMPIKVRKVLQHKNRIEVWAPRDKGGVKGRSIVLDENLNLTVIETAQTYESIRNQIVY